MFQEDIRIWKNRLRWAIYHEGKDTADNEDTPIEPPSKDIELALIKSHPVPCRFTSLSSSCGPLGSANYGMKILFMDLI